MRHYIYFLILIVVVIIGLATQPIAPEDMEISKSGFCDEATKCGEGSDCIKFQDEDEPICYQGDPCVKCESKQCDIEKSYPIQVYCT